MSMGKLSKLMKKEDGLGTVEIVIIIAVLVGLALIFRNQIYSFVNQVFERIFGEAGNVISVPSGTDIPRNTIGP